MNKDFLNFNQFADSLQKARNFADKFKYRCCCPNCEKDAIKSHLLQRHPLLTSIADDKNRVLQFEDNWEDARSGRWNFYVEKSKGINDAMQYRLFCGKHDSEMYKDLENRNSIPTSKRDCLLLAYRAACSVRNQEERRMHLYEYMNQQEPNEINTAFLMNSKSFVRRMCAVIDNIWKGLEGDADNYLFRMIAIPYFPVAVSDCIVDDEDFQTHIMDDEYSKPFNCYFVNLIPDNDRLLVLLGCDTRFDRHGDYKKIVSDFPSDCNLPYKFFVETLWGILIKCHNWCCSPKLEEDPQWKEFFEDYERLKIKDILK